MTAPSDIPDTTMSLDSVFTPPSREQWEAIAAAGLGSSLSDSEALQSLRRITLDGIPLEILYDQVSTSFQSPPGSEHKENWDNRLSVQITDAATANKEILQGLAGGITSIELTVTKAEDIASALQGTQLKLAKTSLRAGQHVQVCAKALEQLAESQGIASAALQCAFNADPIGTYLSGASNDDTLNTDIEQMALFANASAQRSPLSTSVLVDAAVHHNAGASTVEELHAVLATAVLYLEAMLDAGMSINDAHRQISFQLGMDADVLLGVAKLRALKALWMQLVPLMDSAVDQVQPACIVAETSQRFCSKLEPWNNHLRNLAASTAAVLGGADTLIVHPHDTLQRAAGTIDTAIGDRMARNIAIILERECGLRKVHDPMAGSYAIENLTLQLIEQVWQGLSSTDTSEGWLDELTSGRWQTRLTQTQQQRVALMKNEQRIAIGVNRFVQADDSKQEVSTSNALSSARLEPVREAEYFERQAEEGGMQ